MRSLGHQPTEEEVQDMINEVSHTHEELDLIVVCCRQFSFDSHKHIVGITGRYGWKWNNRLFRIH